MPSTLLPEIADPITSPCPGLSGQVNGSFAPGSTVGELRIERQLGRGGMGVVFAAWDTIADRPVAVKVLGAAITNPELFARFRREAATTARLHHPGIVQVYGAGQTTESCYLLMQRVDGMTLREWLDWAAGLSTFDTTEPTPGQVPAAPLWVTEPCEVRFDPDAKVEEATPPPPSSPARSHVVTDSRYVRRVAEMLRDLADAVAHAHEHGVTHRDLKPENVMVTDEGKVVVIDFGLARSFADTTLTTHSGLMGTPLYMAPEQLAGKPASPASDVYAIGLIGYELFTHALPFKAGTVERLLGEVLHKPAPPLIARNPAVPPELANIIHQAMAKKPGERYPTAAELWADLDRHLSDERVTASKYQYRFNARELVAARPKRVTLAGYVIALLGGLLGLYGLLATASNSNPASLGVTLGGGLFLAAAWWLLSGRRGGWTVGVGVAGTLFVWVMWALWQYLTVSLNRVPPLLIAVLLMIPTVIAGSILAALLNRRARDWFRQVKAERREFSAEGQRLG